MNGGTGSCQSSAGNPTGGSANHTMPIVRRLKEALAPIIGEEVWKTSKDVRDVVSLSKLIRKSDGPDEIDGIMRALTKYGGPT